MNLHDGLAALPPREREEFCRRVLDSLSDLVERRAPDEFCRRVEAIFGGSVPFRVLCDTLHETINLAHACGEDSAATLDERAFDLCVERVRRRVEPSRNGLTDARPQHP